MDGEYNSSIDIPAGGFVSDGGWHLVTIDLTNDNIELTVDGRVIFSEKRKNIDITKLDDITNISMEDTFYIGKLNNK